MATSPTAVNTLTQIGRDDDLITDPCKRQHGTACGLPSPIVRSAPTVDGRGQMAQYAKHCARMQTCCKKSG
jgi:hypothetical protein